MSFFMDMSDTEIAKHMNLVRSTIHHHRVSSLQALKKIMEAVCSSRELKVKRHFYDVEAKARAKNISVGVE